MTAHPKTPEDEDEEIFEHTSPGGLAKYLSVFVALCLLTGLSFAVGNSQTLRENSPAVMWAMMMAVSCAKALLVILFFMHLLWEANWKYVLTIPASLMSIFLLLMLIPDIGRRTEHYSDQRWLHAPRPQKPHHDSAAGGEHSAAGEHSDEHGHEPGAKSEPAHAPGH